MAKKSFFLYLMLNLHFLPISSQMWDIGTTWVYEQDDFAAPKENYVIFKIIGDTTINHQRALKLIEYYCEQDCNNPPLNRIITHLIRTDNDKVYYFDKDSNDFYLLYDFSIQQDDLIISHVGPIRWFSEPHFIEYYATIQGTDTTSGDIRTNYLYENFHDFKYNYFGKIIKWIGNLKYLFPIPAAIDPSPGGKLLCFTDGNIYFPKDIICKLPNSTYLSETTKLNLYPNPTTGISYTTFDLKNGCRIFDIYGNQQNVKLKENVIDLGEFIPGIYYLVLNNKISPIRILKI